MISVGSIVTIGDEKYVVTSTKEHQCACTVCEIKNCAYNKALQEFKKSHGVTACEKIIGVNKYFKKYEQHQ